jgi:hypothetical protein
MWSFLWEFIKIIIPTAVAIAAILVNNRRAEKRDRANKKKDLLLKWRYELLSNTSDLSIMVDEINEAYINIMDAYEIKKCEKYQEVFKRSHFKYMGHVRKVANFAYSMKVSEDIKNVVEETRSMADKYIKTLIDIKTKYRPGLVRSKDEVEELKEINEIILEMYASINKLNDVISNDIIKLLD